MKKVILTIVVGAAALYAGDFYLYKQYYNLGFDTAEQQYRKLLVKEGYAFYDTKTGNWQICPRIDRETTDLNSYAYGLENELSLVRAQIEAQSSDLKKKKK
jgi:hypothetical protein